MAEPTNKHPDIDALLTSFTGIDRVLAINDDTCAMCDGPATEVVGRVSRKEYIISGMCQKCQNEVFYDEEEYES